MGGYLLVSADGHAGLPTAQYRHYLERRYHSDFDAELARLKVLRESFLNAARLTSDPPLMYKAHMHRYSDKDNAQMQERCRGAWDAAVRIREMDREGIAGDVIFPDGQGFNAFPFGGFFGEDPLPQYKAELRIAGAKAHNRWLAEFCSYDRTRLFGMALIMPYDIADAVAEVRRAAAEGLRGVVLPAPDETLELYHDRKFDPLWAVCSELGMPVHSHGGDPPKIYGTGAAVHTLGTMELGFFRKRILAQLVFGGVFSRHPKLRFVYTEVGVDWIPGYLERLERVYHDDWLRLGHPPKKWLPLSPMQCWQRNCAAGATFPAYEEIQLGMQLGTDTLMWGSDYPHVEGSWPSSWEEIRQSFAGVADEDLRKMIGLNAARLYNFDMQAMNALVERIGPAEGTFAGGSPPAQSRYTPGDFTDGWVNTYGGFARNLERSLSN